MSAAISPTMGARYGVQRVCAAWEQPRSTYYAQVARAAHPVAARPGQKRGPKTALSDAALLTAIREAIAESPFHGEGYRKVWAWLRYGPRQLHVGHNRVLRVMRQGPVTLAVSAASGRS